MNKTYIQKGKNAKDLWVVEVIDNARNWTEEIRTFVRKSDMAKWLKQQKQGGNK